jgi:hypothetical protein
MIFDPGLDVFELHEKPVERAGVPGAVAEG